MRTRGVVIPPTALYTPSAHRRWCAPSVSIHYPARPADPPREKSENVFHGPSTPPPVADAAAADVQLEAYSPAQNAAADNADGQ